MEYQPEKIHYEACATFSVRSSSGGSSKLSLCSFHPWAPHSSSSPRLAKGKCLAVILSGDGKTWATEAWRAVVPPQSATKMTKKRKSIMGNIIAYKIIIMSELNSKNGKKWMPNCGAWVGRRKRINSLGEMNSKVEEINKNAFTFIALELSRAMSAFNHPIFSFHCSFQWIHDTSSTPLW